MRKPVPRRGLIWLSKKITRSRFEESRLPRAQFSSEAAQRDAAPKVNGSVFREGLPSLIKCLTQALRRLLFEDRIHTQVS